MEWLSRRRGCILSSQRPLSPGHEHRPPEDRYDNLNGGQEYPSPIDGKRGWNDFCTGGVAHYPRKDGFHQGHEHLPRKDRHNTLNRGQNILCQLMGRGDRMTFAPAKLHVIPTMRLPFRSWMLSSKWQLLPWRTGTLFSTPFSKW